MNGADTADARAVIAADAARFEGVVFLGEAPVVGRCTPSWPRSIQTNRAAEDDDAHPPVFDWLCGTRGLNPNVYRSVAIRRRERACTRALGAATPAEAARRAARAPEVLDRALNAVLIGVTSFFREPAAFEALGREAVSLAGPDREWIDVVSVACSDGCELYSAGIVLAEACGLERLRLRGIDCRPAAIRKAAAGAYSIADVATLRPERRAQWFDVNEKSVQVRAALRERAEWQVGDAFEMDPAMRADVVLCRNLAIYLRASAVQRLWQSIAERLRPGGLLMVGKAERVTNVPSLRWIGPCLYRKSDAK